MLPAPLAPLPGSCCTLSPSHGGANQLARPAQLPSGRCPDTLHICSPLLTGGRSGKARGSARACCTLRTGMGLGSHPALEGSRQSSGQLCLSRSSEVVMLLFQVSSQFEDSAKDNTSGNALRVGAFEDQQHWQGSTGQRWFPWLLGQHPVHSTHPRIPRCPLHLLPCSAIRAQADLPASRSSF